jgi:hypothetical protein
MTALTVVVIIGFFIVTYNFSATWRQLDRIEKKLDDLKH